MKRWNRIVFVPLLALVCLTASGCMRRENGMIEAPSPSPSFMPQQSMTDARPESTQRYDWTRNAAQVETKLQQISEIAEARVVVTGDTALVGVKFNEAYQGEMTERIREMIAAEVMQADPQITTVAVTADEDDVKSVYDISERSLAGREVDRLKEDILEIVRNATTLR